MPFNKKQYSVRETIKSTKSAFSKLSFPAFEINVGCLTKPRTVHYSSKRTPSSHQGPASIVLKLTTGRKPGRKGSSKDHPGRRQHIRDLTKSGSSTPGNIRALHVDLYVLAPAASRNRVSKMQIGQCRKSTRQYLPLII